MGRPASRARKTCEQCFNQVSIHKFFKAGRKKKGYFPICKDCIIILTAQNNLTEVATILRRMDRIFIRDVWDNVYYKYGDKAFGRYMQKVQSLKQYKDLGWEDSKFENEEDFKNSEVFFNQEWQGSFNIHDLNYLNNYYDDLHRDYKITTRNHKDYARKIAKASLAMDKAYERMTNGKDPAAKTEFKNLRETFDALSKSAQFTESTRSANDVGLGSFGIIFDKVEKRQWIPPHRPTKKDTYDTLLAQFANIEKSL